MGFFASLFPQDDYSLLAVILAMPLLGALVNGLWGKRLGKDAVRVMAVTSVAVSFVCSVVVLLALAHWVDATGHVENGKTVHDHVRITWTAWQWMHTNGGRGGGGIPIDAKFSVDALSSMMMLIITGVGSLIHLYATAYMAEDKGFHRFFCYLNLFVFAMLVLVMADNLPVLFIGWEGVGLCSYLLIGFWYDKEANAAAGKKAFIANRIGDFGLLSAMFLLVRYTGALDWNGIANGATSLLTPGETWRVHVWPLGGGQYTGVLSFLQPGFFQAHHTPLLQSLMPAHAVTVSAATAVGLALLLGCTGKSAQIPLYVWLPDAMAGPTPVSALIHAATMVTAGIYLICRLSFVFVLSPGTMMIIAVVGASTALFAATIAVVQNDIKKVLAYSTVSQLGFMFLGVGAGAFTAGFFHLFTHAFFKACLFLCAGSVIHAMHARIHDDDAAQDIRNMGGLRNWLPLTHGTFAVATAAIIGLPLTSGFFSKDEILYRAFVDHTVNPMAGVGMLRRLGVYEPPKWIGPVLYVAGVLAATLTAFYMCRLYFLTFWGDFRGWKVGRPSLLAKHEIAQREAGAPPSTGPAAEGAADVQSAPTGHGPGGSDHGEDDRSQPGYPPHESPWQMTVPLIILAAFSAFAGWLNPGFHLMEPMHHWLSPVFAAATEGAVTLRPGAEHLEWTLALGGLLAFGAGTALAWWIYLARKGEPARRAAEAQPALYHLVLDKWRVDEFYDVTAIAAVDSLAETSAAFDRTFVDGIIARLTSLLVAAAGTVLRAFQNGVVHVYAALMVVGLAATGWFFTVPHPNATVVDAGNSEYVLTAAPGVGYAYRWDADGDGKPENQEFTGDTTLKVHVEPGKSATVHLEVKNAFGLVRTKTIHVARPQEPISSL
jgi:NADH-quinone oxidoreductase subunit L